jgi:hypothetical protein
LVLEKWLLRSIARPLTNGRFLGFNAVAALAEQVPKTNGCASANVQYKGRACENVLTAQTTLPGLLGFGSLFDGAG